MPVYDPHAIEAKWQEFWEKRKSFCAPDTGSRPKLYVLDMFPYPSGEGLHVGHPEGYSATDMYSRYQRMKGYNVLHPWGYDAFGLPAEQYAIETGTHPRVTTERNIANIRRQVKRLGLSFDWDREFALLEIPFDFYRMLKETDVPDESVRKIPLDWRLATREVFQELLKHKYKVIDFRIYREKDRKRNFYVLKK